MRNCLRNVMATILCVSCVDKSVPQLIVQVYDGSIRRVLLDPLSAIVLKEATLW